MATAYRVKRHVGADYLQHAILISFYILYFDIVHYHLKVGFNDDVLGRGLTRQKIHSRTLCIQVVHIFIKSVLKKSQK